MLKLLNARLEDEDEAWTIMGGIVTEALKDELEKQVVNPLCNSASKCVSVTYL
jgi:hypothetical protein